MILRRLHRGFIPPKVQANQTRMHFYKNVSALMAYASISLATSTAMAQNSSQTVYTPLQLKTLTASFLADHYASEDKIEISVGNLDPRIGQKVCRSPLVFDPRDPNEQGGNIQVQINCTDTISWALYVPALVAIYKEVPVATQDLLRGHVISPDDIEYQEVNLSSYRYKIFTDLNDIAGKELKRNIGKGTVFIPAALDNPTLIRRNDLVQVITEIGGIAVKVEGTAMSDGRERQTIRIRNNQSKRVVSGTVIASGIVKVN